ncbi:hypothetical protein ACVWYH_007862 [Bradyrhizobium sp. GM24.11]
MKIIVFVLTLLVPALAWAQTPYAGMQSRQIKALSDQQIADLRAGRGMGLALAAELNGYPGPTHVLELADQLGLSPDQRSKVGEMFSKMKADTTPIGNKLIEQESDLDRQFSGRTITAANLETATSAISKTQGELREAHLKYHLLTAAILDQTQLAKYAELRGYASDTPVPQHSHHH